MAEILTSAQMRAIEQAAIESGGTTGAALMERAGAGVVACVKGQWPGLLDLPRAVIVLCGPGNNGGDGFVIARVLRELGMQVRVHAMHPTAAMQGDARIMAERWSDLGSVQPLEDVDFDNREPPDLVIDALFGSGLSRPLAGPALAALQRVAQVRRIVAVDVLSGIDADSGQWLGPEAMPCRPHLTVSFHMPRPAHFLGPAHVSGALSVIDIGLPLAGSGAARHPVPMARQSRVWQVRPVAPGRLDKGDVAGRERHKFQHGHALVMSGGAGQTGAARLAARAALRIGAGLVSIGAPGSAQMEVALQITALMLTRMDGGADLHRVLADSRITALCLGPSLGFDARAIGLVTAALAPEAGQRPMVLDADALTILAAQTDPFASLHPACVLTPHAGEFARLFPDLAQRLVEVPQTAPAFSRIDATRAAAARAGCVVLLKGAATVIATPDGACAVHAALYERAAPWLATAGSGDVLAGFITGLMARGFDAFDAACTATWLHTECARQFGPGLIAEDLAEVLPQVLRAGNHPHSD